MTPVIVVAAAAMGLAVGSFLNVVVYRVPRGESVVHPRSRCPQCGRQLSAGDNIPVLSWLLLRGRCRTCRAPISARYPAIELGTALLFALLAWRLHDDAALPAFLVFAAAGIAVSAVDLERFIVPNRIVYPALGLIAPLLVVAAAVEGEWGSLGRAAVGGAVGFGALFAIHLVSPRGMGFGDVRLAGLLGVVVGWLGVAHVLLALFLGFLSGSLVSVGLVATRLRTRKDRVPFGPFLVLGAVLAILLGQPILRWYGV